MIYPKKTKKITTKISTNIISIYSDLTPTRNFTWLISDRRSQPIYADARCVNAAIINTARIDRFVFRNENQSYAT